MGLNNFTFNKEREQLEGRFPLSALPKSLLGWIENNLNEVILVTNQQGMIEFVSNSVELLLGYKKKNLIGTSWREKVSYRDAQYILNYFKDTSSVKQDFILTLAHANGKLMQAMATVERIKDDIERKEYYITSIKDITFQKEAEEFLMHSEKMSVAGQLAAGIAHEIRNPLTSLKGFLQLLQAGVNRKEEYYQIMIEEIEKMEKITSELLFISKPLTDQKKWEPIAEMVDDVIHLLRPQAKLKNININVECNKNIGLHCDRSQMKQVFINLIKNAIEAMDRAGNIYLTVQELNREVIIKIVDEGSGIPKEIIEKLGEPFFTTKKDGTGLGIMISNQIIEAHDGVLDISPNVPKGSIFKLTFPRYEFNN